MNNEKRKLNVGAGSDIRPGWINLDSVQLAGIDVAHDIENLPLPFSNDIFDEIVCQDVLEHTNVVPVLKDLHRILKKDGLLHIRVPHFTSKNNYIDPTHKTVFSSFAFDYFAKNAYHSKSKLRSYYFDFQFEKFESVKITFERSSRFFFYNGLIDRLVNRSRRMHYLYESTGLSRLFPAENILITLKK